MNHHTIKEIELRVRRVDVGEDQAPYNVKVDSPTVVHEVAAAVLKETDQEHFLVFLLGIHNKLTGYLEVHRGGLDSCPVDPRVVFRAAVVDGATAVIVVHNHPSGDPSPSTEDVNLTKRLVKAGEVLGVKVLDHLIVAGERYYAFAEHGLI